MYPGFPGLGWITPYGVLLVLACITAWWLARRRATATGLDPSHIDLALPLAFVGGAFFAGARGARFAFFGAGAPVFFVAMAAGTSVTNGSQWA